MCQHNHNGSQTHNTQNREPDIVIKHIVSGVILISAVIFFSILFANDSHPGEELYADYCATCHGTDLMGGNAGSLVDGNWQFGSSREALYKNISEGIEDYGMPGYSESLSPAEINQLVDFLAAKSAEYSAERSDIDQTISTRDYEIGVQTWVEDLEIPWAIDFIDNNTALITERPGRLRTVFKGKLAETPVQNTPEVLHRGQGGLMDVAVDPEYAKNGWIYLAYTHAPDPGEDKPGSMTRIVRGKISNNTWTGQQVIYEADPGHYFNTHYHYGCRVVFDRKGYLYFSIGDRGRRELAQDISLPNGKIHRIFTDGRIPEDNPFIGQKDALPTIYTYGNRNPQGMAVHPETDEVWATEHGPLGGDELNLIKPGINYGWPVITYGKNYNGTIISDLTEKEGMEQPIIHWTPSIAVCGLDFYRGNQFPEWQNDLLVGALKYEEVRLVSINENRVIHQEVILKDFGRVRDVTTGPDGAIYVVLNDPDDVLKLTRLEE